MSDWYLNKAIQILIVHVGSRENYMFSALHAQRMNPDRTRATNMRVPLLGQAESEDHKFEKKRDFAETQRISFTCGQKIKTLETCSAVFSGVAFIVAIVMISLATWSSDKPNYNPPFPVWWSDITIVDLQDSGKMQAVADFSTAWQSTCSKNKPDAVNGTQFALQDIELQLLPATRRIETAFYPMWALAWIFFLSFVMQLSRSYSDSKYAFITKWFGYEAVSKVEFTRWLEYALTSPLQIWIVASLFFVGDIMTLTALAGSQLGLVLLGALIEYYNGQARKKTRKQHHIKAQSANNCAYATCLLAWIIHVLIWFPLFWRFRYQIDKSDTCVPQNLKTNWDEARTYVELTFYLQFALFSAFGLWLTYVTFFEDAGGRQHDAGDKEKRWMRRLTDSGIYAMLSISAKVFLDFGFLAIIFIRARQP